MKNQPNTIFAGIFLLFAFFQFSCNKEIILPDISGSLVGYVKLLDDFGVAYENQSDVSIKTVGTHAVYVVKSDSKGRFEFFDLPAGTYDFEFSKNGFGSVWLKGVRHLGGEPTILQFIGNYIYPVELVQIPSTVISNLSLEADSLFADFIFTNNQPDQVKVLIYFSDVPDFEIANSQFIRSFLFTKSSGGYSTYFDTSFLQVSSGQNFYTKARVCSSPVPECLQLIDNSYISCSTSYVFYPSLGNEFSAFSFVFP